MTREEWHNLNVNDVIYTSTGRPRKIIRTSLVNEKTSCISLEPLRKTKFDDMPVYCSNDCLKFFLEKPSK